MSEHEEFVSDLAKRASIKSGLIESRVLGSGGKQVRVFVSTSGRIGASVDSTGVNFNRKLGPMDGMKISWRALQSVEAARQHWKQHRDSWALFETNMSGFPPGYGSGNRVQAPGAKSEYALIGSNVMGHRRGKSFTGKEELRKPSRKWDVHGFEVDFELWRVGEEQTPPEGWPVGLMYGLYGGYTAAARRYRLEVIFGFSSVSFEAHDEQIVPLLLSIGKESGYVPSEPKK